MDIQHIATKNRIIAITALAAATTAFAACGRGDDADTSDTGVPTSAPAATSPAQPTAASAATAVAEPTEPATGSATTIRLNLNTASGEDYLAVIPGFTDRFVREFLEYKPYVSIQQFRQELGKYVDEAQVAEWEQYVYVPVDVNNADAETLMQLPGVDETIAGELIGGRDYASNDDFEAALAEYVSAEDAAAAAGLLATE